MKINVQHEKEGTVELELKPPSRGEVRKGFNALLNTGELEEGQTGVEETRALTEAIESMVQRGTDKSEEWLDELSAESYREVEAYYVKQIQDRSDFFQQSGKQPSS